MNLKVALSEEAAAVLDIEMAEIFPDAEITRDGDIYSITGAYAHQMRALRRRAETIAAAQQKPQTETEARPPREIPPVDIGGVWIERA